MHVVRYSFIHVHWTSIEQLWHTLRWTLNMERISKGLHWFQACHEAHCVLKVVVAIGETGSTGDGH